MVLDGVHVEDRLVVELARIVPPKLERKLATAHALHSQVIALTADERAAVLEALERPPEGLGDLREALLGEVKGRNRQRR